MNWSRRILVATAAFAAAALILFAGTRAGASARAVCAGQNDAGAPGAAQERAMLCLVNRARQGRGLEPLAAPASLARAAARC